MNMKEIHRIHDNLCLYDVEGELIYLVDGLAMEEGQGRLVKYGLLQSDLGKYYQRGLAVAIAQFYELVGNGLIAPSHIFIGLKRPLYADKDMDADTQKIIIALKPKIDCDWKTPHEMIKLDAPANRVFVTIISKNDRHRARFPYVYGWIEQWNWVDEDKGLKEAPINWLDRYREKIYSRLQIAGGGGRT